MQWQDECPDPRPLCWKKLLALLSVRLPFLFKLVSAHLDCGMTLSYRPSRVELSLSKQQGGRKVFRLVKRKDSAHKRVEAVESSFGRFPPYSSLFSSKILVSCPQRSSRLQKHRQHSTRRSALLETSALTTTGAPLGTSIPYTTTNKLPLKTASPVRTPPQYKATQLPLAGRNPSSLINSLNLPA